MIAYACDRFLNTAAKAWELKLQAGHSRSQSHLARLASGAWVLGTRIKVLAAAGCGCIQAKEHIIHLKWYYDQKITFHFFFGFRNFVY